MLRIGKYFRLSTKVSLLSVMLLAWFAPAPASASSYLVTEESDWYFTVSEDDTLVVIYGNSNESCSQLTTDPYLWLYADETESTDVLIASNDDGNHDAQNQCVSSKIHITLNTGSYRLHAGYCCTQLGLGNVPSWGDGTYELVTDLALVSDSVPTTTTTVEPPTTTTTTITVTTTTEAPPSTSSTTTTTSLTSTTTVPATTTTPTTSTVLVTTSTSTSSSTTSTTTTVASTVVSTVVGTTVLPTTTTTTIQPTTSTTSVPSGTTTSTTTTPLMATTTTSTSTTTTIQASVEEQRAEQVLEELQEIGVDAEGVNATEVDIAEIKIVESLVLVDEDFAESFLKVVDGDITVEEIELLVTDDNFDSLDDSAKAIVVQSVNDASDEVKRQFEEVVDIFDDEAFNAYVAEGSVVTVQTRRTVVAATAAAAVAASVSSGSSSGTSNGDRRNNFGGKK